MLLYIAIGLLGTALWIAYEIKRAPYYDEQTHKFYNDYDSYKHRTTERTNDEASNSRAQRNQASTKRSKKTKGN